MKQTSMNTNVAEQGKYIAVRQFYNYFINLYLWENEFYEARYFRPTNEIEKIEKFKKMEA